VNLLDFKSNLEFDISGFVSGFEKFGFILKTGIFSVRRLRRMNFSIRGEN
jgi:hypothetical protein